MCYLNLATAQDMAYVDCFYGWTTDKDDDIDEDWDHKCGDDLPNSDGAGCQNVRCTGGCFKARIGQ